MANRRLLVVDAYPRDGRARLTDAGGTEAGTLYQRLLERLAPRTASEIAHPADDERPGTRELGDFDGAVWTGSNLSILDADDPRVSRQIELVRDLMREGVPCFGSCFAIQVAAVALGGRCRANPKGREFGVSRRIWLTAEGCAHPLYHDKPPLFDAFTSHADEVAELPPGAHRLAANDFSSVQGAEIAEPDGGTFSFQAVQYHPEYDLHEVASLARLRRTELVAQGTFASDEEADAWIRDLEALHTDPSRADLAQRHGIGESLLDATIRTLEVRNWLSPREGRLA
jgi:GMP synthase (glutamine-hydrolysing)